MIITEIKKSSLAQKIGLSVGDHLLKINGKRVIDYIDYQFRITSEEVTLDFQVNGKLKQIYVEKEYDDDLGVTFQEMKIRKCGNDCIFCFVDQNPDGMRDGIYFRDGDYRMSFLHGHFITMTNMGMNELKRIVAQRLSPLYISVHTTDGELRKKLLLYGKEDHLLDKIKYLIHHNIELHGQVVLLPGVNDGEPLYRTIKDLYEYYPKFKTLSIVPVGLTKHREGLPEIKYISRDYSAKILEEHPKLQKIFPGSVQEPFILLADEWYILGGKPFPEAIAYGSHDLIENGIGQSRNFLDRFKVERKQFPKSFKRKTKLSFVTGELIYKTFLDKVKPYLDQIENLEVDFFPIKNNFFGDSVNVSGLLTGKDIIEQLKDKNLGDTVWTTERILNDEKTLTLDDMTLDSISEALGCPLKVTNDSFLSIIKEECDAA